MKQLFLWDGKNLLEGTTCSIANSSLERFIQAGLFRLPTCTMDDGTKAIDLKIFIVKVQKMINDHGTITDRNVLIPALRHYRYLQWVDHDTHVS